MNNLKEYYVNLNKMMENAVNMLTAINQSLISSSQSVTSTVVMSNGETMQINIPSFLYLENKLEQLENNFTSLFHLPESGEAWFNNDSETYKIQLVKSTTAPIVPTINTSQNITASFTENNILKDLVNPKTYIRLNISNIPDNVDKMYMKKFIIYNTTLANVLSQLTSINDWNEILYSMQKGVDYDEYESVLNMPVKKDAYLSEFRIQEVITPAFDINNQSYNWDGKTYVIQLNSLTYYNAEDNSIEYTLSVGSYLTLGNTIAVYKIIDIETLYTSTNTSSSNTYKVTLEEYIGHVILQSYENNNEMILQIYNNNFDKYHYVDVPLEENPYIGIFLSTLYNNVRSNYSDAIFLDLNTIYMKNEDGNYITSNGVPISYMDFYNRFCKNIGDMIQSFTDTAYSQLANYTNNELEELVESDVIKGLVTDTLYDDKGLVLTVQRINKHLIDDVTSEEIIKYHNQKTQLMSQLNAIQDNIDQTYNQLVTTDFSQDVSATQESLQSQLSSYYSQKSNLQKNIINIVDSINLLSGNTSEEKAKFRIRGVTNVYDKTDNVKESEIISYLNDTYTNVELIGLEIQYKYKSINNTSTTLASTNNSVFTDWNFQTNNNKERFLKFDTNYGYQISYINYNMNNNVIKWNQVDIPITQNEEVIIRIRYKYSVGQPFINLYTPWSDEVTINFPTELLEATDLPSILSQNETDTLNARFNSTLINDGYFEHVNNKTIFADQTFYHQPENIYSGFNTAENNALSLKQYLTKLTNELDEYKELLKEQIQSKFKVYFEYDGNVLELHSGLKEKININASLEEHLDSFTKKQYKIVIKNEGASPVNLYSLFPGDSDIKLLEYNYIDGEYATYERLIGDYERVPLLFENVNDKLDSIYYQTFGQWIYFRQNNIYTKYDYYLNNRDQNDYDDLTYNQELVKNKTSLYKYTHNLFNYLGKDNLQALLPYKPHYTTVKSIVYALNKWGKLTFNENNIIVAEKATEDDLTLNDGKETLTPFFSETQKHKFIYDAMLKKTKEYNNFALKYEHLSTGTEEVFDETSIISGMNMSAMFDSSVLKNNTLAGAFLIPEIQSQTQVLCSKERVNKDQQAYKLDVGNSVVIPVLFEYYLNSSLTNVKKTISFDIKPSLFKDPFNYTLEVNVSLNTTEEYDAAKFNGSTLYDTLIN